MKLKVEQEKLPNLNNREKIVWGKKMNRTSGTCGTIINALTLVFLPHPSPWICEGRGRSPRKEKKEGEAEKVFKEIMTKKFSNLAKLTDSRKLNKAYTG